MGSNPTGRILDFWGPAVIRFQILFICQKHSVFQNFCYECVGNDQKIRLVNFFSKKSTPGPRYGHFGDFSQSGGAGSNPTGRINSKLGSSRKLFSNFIFLQKNIPFLKKNCYECIGTDQKIREVKMFSKNPRLARDMAILVIFHKKGVITPHFFAVGFG